MTYELLESARRAGDEDVCILEEEQLTLQVDKTCDDIHEDRLEFRIYVIKKRFYMELKKNNTDKFVGMS